MKKLVFLLLLLFFTKSSFAVNNGYKQVTLNVINTQKKVYQFFVELDSSTYKIDFSRQLKNIVSGYRQNILWIRGEFLGVETFNATGDLVHLILQYDDVNISKNFTDNKLSYLEVFPAFVNFYAKEEPTLLGNYHNLGIDYTQVDTVQQGLENFRNQEPDDFDTAQKKLEFFYKLGGEHFYILVNKNDYKIAKFSRILHYNNELLVYDLYFSSWHIDHDRIPQTIKHYLNDELFKIDEVVFIATRYLGNKRQQFLNKYRGL